MKTHSMYLLLKKKHSWKRERGILAIRKKWICIGRDCRVKSCRTSTIIYSKKQKKGGII